jgi:phosphate starvation-inducible PhoH-like protein
MNKILLFLVLTINAVYSFIPIKFKNRNLLNLTSKKTNKFKQSTITNIDYYTDYYYNVEYDKYIEEPIHKKNDKYYPKGINQKNYVTSLDDNDITLIFATGPAGSGKTLFACIHAINALKKKSVSKIILTRPVIAVEDEEIGYLPGDLKHKMDPWTKPIFDIFLEYFKQSEIDQMIKESIIEITPLSFMRGRTFKNSIIIADEMQNSTPNQMLMCTTRIGINSKMIICGDLLQTDRSIDNGLNDIIDRLNTSEKKYSNIKIIELFESDIQRSQIVKDILEIYKK